MIFLDKTEVTIELGKRLETWNMATTAGAAASRPKDREASSATRMEMDSTKCSGQTASADRGRDEEG